MILEMMLYFDGFATFWCFGDLEDFDGFEDDAGF